MSIPTNKALATFLANISADRHLFGWSNDQTNNLLLAAKRMEEISHLEAEIAKLRQLLKFARDLIGHPDDAGTQMIEAALAETDAPR